MANTRFGDPAIRHVACFGLMAAGKSTVGARVAAQLGWPFVDVDAEVEARAGRTVEDLAYEGGEEAYRPWERQVVLDVLESPEPSVVAAPGGIALDPQAKKAMGAIDVVAVYLRANPDALAAQIALESGHEPSYGGRDPLAALRSMFDDRDATYRAVADIEVQVDGRSLEEIASVVVAAVTGTPAPPRDIP